MSNPEAELAHDLQEILRIEKEPVWRAVITPHEFVFPGRPCGRVRRIKPSGDQALPTGRNGLYRSNRPGPNLCKSCLPTFAGKVIFGCVRATSATDVPTLSYTGVARKAWISLPAFGPLSTNAMPEICPRSLILFAMTAYRLELAGNSVLRSVNTPFCQMKPWDQLKLESKALPTTWPWLLMPLAKAPKSPGRRPRFVIAPFCQRVAYLVVPSGLRLCPTIWPWSLMPLAILERAIPKSGSGKAVPFSHNTA